MLDSQAVLGQARQRPAPATWRVFTKARGRVRGFLSGTSGDPDPLLVITSDGVVEYISNKKPVAVIDFDQLLAIRLQVSAYAGNGGLILLAVWLDLQCRDGTESSWRSASFSVSHRTETVQAFIEAYAIHQAQRITGP